MHVYGSRCHELSYILPHAVCVCVVPRHDIATQPPPPPGNKRAVAPIHVSTVTRMEWQGIAAATSAASSPHTASLVLLYTTGSGKPCSLKPAAPLGVCWCFTGMSMPSANNTLSGWAEIQYSSAFYTPTLQTVCAWAQRQKKCLTAATKITIIAAQIKKNVFNIFKKLLPDTDLSTLRPTPWTLNCVGYSLRIGCPFPARQWYYVRIPQASWRLA